MGNLMGDMSFIIGLKIVISTVFTEPDALVIIINSNAPVNTNK